MLPELSGAAEIRVCIAGITGWTGRAVADAVRAAEDLELVSGVSRTDPDSHSSVETALDAARADVLVDYTHASVVKANVLAAVERGVNVVVGSSGLSATDYDTIDAGRARERGRSDRGGQLLADRRRSASRRNGRCALPRNLGDPRLRKRR